MNTWVMYALFLGAASGLVGCARESAHEEESTVFALLTDSEIEANNSQYVELDGSPSHAHLPSSNVVFEWMQTSGPAALVLESEDVSKLSILTPTNITQATTLTFELTVTDGESTDVAEVNVFVTPCEVSEGVVFDECLSTDFGPFGSYERKEPVPEEVFEDGVFVNGQGDRHLTWEIVDSGDTNHDKVLRAHFSANDPFEEFNDNAWMGLLLPQEFLVEGGQRLDLTEYIGGLIQFDVRMLSGENPRLEAAAECGWPCTSEIIVFDATYEWQTITIAIDDLIESGAEIDQLTVGLLVRPPWNQQQVGVFEFDNIQLVKSGG